MCFEPGIVIKNMNIIQPSWEPDFLLLHIGLNFFVFHGGGGLGLAPLVCQLFGVLLPAGWSELGFLAASPWDGVIRLAEVGAA